MRCKKFPLWLFLMVMSPVLPAQQAMTGKALYEQSCLVCHGDDGSGVMPGVVELPGTGGPLSKSDQQLAKAIREGIQREGAVMAMPPLGGNAQLTDQDIQEIILYMRKTF
ncbi:c-type cytochrome [Sulfuriflexus mobilis]|uniref:c-type cytochrome n=1 Tax=Sulfuriflexus mobilis TaxID=1811807 RepID=UPI000F824517|nr:cytochrome c [Sulfuriflexus mobilis]